MSSFYPVLGATGGATVGSLGGPAGAGGGAVVGYGVGKGAQLVEENKDLADTVEALSEGDVQKLVQMGVEKAKEENKGALEKVWWYLKWGLGVVVLWNLIPLFLAQKACRKSAENQKNIESNGKDKITN